jgi:hypothetical protein
MSKPKTGEDRSDYFNLNLAPLVPVSEQAAEEVSASDLAELFSALEKANALWNDPQAGGERKAALAALVAVNAFLERSGFNIAGYFSRPLNLLWLELKNVPPALPGNILPRHMRNQHVERSRRDAVNFCKAGAAFAVDALQKALGLNRAAQRVASLCREHRFPLSDYVQHPGGIRKNRKRKPNSMARGPRAKNPSVDAITTSLLKARERYAQGKTRAAKIYAQFQQRPPVPPEYALHWLAGQLESIGYEKRVTAPASK